MGIDERGWKDEDFTPEVLMTRSEFTQTIFPILLYPVTSRDTEQLDYTRFTALYSLNQMITSFNELVRRVNDQHTYPTVGGRLVVLLHVGLIGSEGTGGLYDAFRQLEGLVN
jgi:hypothetical protein